MPRPKLTKTNSISTSITRSTRTKAGPASTGRDHPGKHVLRRAINASTESDTNSNSEAVVHMPPDDVTMMSGGLGVGDEAAMRGRSRAEKENERELLRLAREGDYKAQAGGRKRGVREKRKADEGVIEGLKRRRDAKMGRATVAEEVAVEERIRVPDEKDQEDDFQPEDESTPLRPVATSGSLRARSVRAEEGEGSKRRKLSASQHTVQVSRSASPEASSIVADRRRGTERSALAVAPRTRGTRTRAVEATTEALSETMVLSASSSAVTSRASPLAVDRNQAVLSSKKTSKPSSRTDDPDMAPPRSPTPSPSSSPSTTRVAISDQRTATTTQPAKRRATKKKQAPQSDALSTATLQNLLPPRRIRPRRHLRYGSHADGDSEGDTRDDPTIFDIRSDSPSLPAHAASEAESEPDGDVADQDFGSRRATKSRSKSKTGKNASSKPHAPSRRSAASRTIPAALTGPARRITNTYTRLHPSPSASSDKENAPNVDPASPSFLANENASSVSPSPARRVEKTARGQASGSRDLAQAARKFQEVDEWKLEFEDVSASLGGSSGMEGAR